MFQTGYSKRDLKEDPFFSYLFKENFKTFNKEKD
jgi:hypothetical protein